MLRRKDIVCERAVELVTDHLEDQLGPSDQSRFEKHLDSCPHCREYLTQMRATIETLRRVEPQPLHPETRDELLQLYQRWQAE